MPLRLAQLARIWASLWRFRTLPLAQRLFGNAASPCILERSLFGFRLLLDVSRSDAQRLLYLEGARYLPERQILASLCRPSSRIADVGANIGYYLLLWERLVGPRGSILCVEPEPENLVELRRNIEANAFENARVLPVAAGAAEGVVAIRPGINSGIDPEGTVQVGLATVDALVSEGIDLLKIDVEGYEGEVLLGSVRTLERHRPTVFVEVHPWLLPSGHSVASILGQLRPLYRRLAAFEVFGGETVLGKAAARYGLSRQIRELGREDIKALEEGAPRHTPFWLVCRP
jgi:FkbM family methyltransferase